MVSRHVVTSVVVAAFLATSVLVQDAFSQRRVFRGPLLPRRTSAPIVRPPAGAGNVSSNALPTYRIEAEKVILPPGHRYVKTKSGNVVVYLKNSNGPDTATLHCACTGGGGGCNIVVVNNPKTTETVAYCVPSAGCSSCGMVIIAPQAALGLLRDAATNKPVKATLIKRPPLSAQPTKTTQ
jgi:hypothetical protein